MKALPLTFVCGLIAAAPCTYQYAMSADETEEPSKPAIYKCISAGRVTYSDTACKNAGEKDKVIVKEANGYTPQPDTVQIESASNQNQRSPDAREQGSLTKAQIAQRERCKQLSEQLESSKQVESTLKSNNRPASYVVMDQSRRVAELEKEYGAAECR